MNRDGGGLEEKLYDNNWAARAVPISLVICARLPNTCNVNNEETSPLHSRLNLHLGTRDNHKIRISM